MPEDISPEERLFRAIHQGKQDDARDSEGSGQSAPARGMKFFNALSFFRKFSFPGLKVKSATAAGDKYPESPFLSISWHDIDVLKLNKIFAGVLAVLILGLTYYGVQEKPDIQKLISRISNVEMAVPQYVPVETFPAMAVYIGAIQQKDIFKPHPAQVKTSAVVSQKVAGVELKQLVQDLKLVGVSWGEAPTAMIRSAREANTYFLKEKQMIGPTGIEVKKILKEKVILGYQGEEVDLQ